MTRSEAYRFCTETHLIECFSADRKERSVTLFFVNGLVIRLLDVDDEYLDRFSKYVTRP